MHPTHILARKPHKPTQVPVRKAGREGGERLEGVVAVEGAGGIEIAVVVGGGGGSAGGEDARGEGGVGGLELGEEGGG